MDEAKQPEGTSKFPGKRNSETKFFLDQLCQCEALQHPRAKGHPRAAVLVFGAFEAPRLLEQAQLVAAQNLSF